MDLREFGIEGSTEIEFLWVRRVVPHLDIHTVGGIVEGVIEIVRDRKLRWSASCTMMASRELAHAA